MKNIIKYIFLFHLLMFCAWAYPSTYTLRGLSVSDGLSDLLVNAIYKDSLGFGKSSVSCPLKPSDSAPLC